MKSKKILYSAVVAVASVLTFSSCNDFLDTMPDNRTTMDSGDKIADLLTNAYPQGNDILVNETMSDNTDYYGATNPNGNRFGDEVYFWQDVMETSNDGPEYFWLEQYQSIAAANEALVDIDKLEATHISSETRTKLEGLRAEALLLRAYGHFKLVTEFSKMYNPATADKDLGIPVSKQVETLTSKHTRGTVAEVYKAIDEDIQAALPLVNDNYRVPKYHFNRKAAYAFAARFYLYYQKWDKVVECANQVLGSNPSAVLRDWQVMGNLARGFEAYNQHYISADLSCNLMLTTKQSEVGVLFGPYIYFKRYSHGRYLGNMEDLNAQNIWGAASYYVKPFTGAGNNYDICQVWKLPYMFEYTDPVLQTGRAHTVNVDFSTDETLLCRAEAYTILKQYDKACADLNTWMHNIVQTSTTLTPQLIKNFYNSVDYSYDDAAKMASTVKKHLNPTFTIDAEGSQQ
ncbi:MAG: RagB/SusD family nutrient uptake outer membrane protein, partial [Prevotellaceae bacterium]|nr:RagB/SusD family nutrient uptake outer membrane protein [Prevotellaceae bacterium]